MYNIGVTSAIEGGGYCNDVYNVHVHCIGVTSAIEGGGYCNDE